jgi:nicotinamidase-related amidase
MIDLQRDFLEQDGGRMPVDSHGAAAVINVANQVLAKRLLPEALPILVQNEFPISDRLGNFFRHDAAIAGSPGAALDSRIRISGSQEVIKKCRPSAFTNAALESMLRERGVRDLYILGVFAEGCVRATACDAVARGYTVRVIEDAVATNSELKKRFGLWAMRRAGATLVRSQALSGSG